MTDRCLELLDLPGPSFILDIGCGSGLSGEIIDEHGHTWAGMDISASMLAVALDRETYGDLILADIGQGIPFRPGTFDAAISVSAVQWLCNAESSDISPSGRLSRFFDGLYASVKRGGKAVLQFYPKNDQQRTMITGAAVKAGFGAGLLEDDPDTKNRKIYLVLTVGSGGELSGRDITDAVRNLEGVEVVDERRRHNTTNKRGETTKQWIIRKKNRDRAKGKVIKSDSKYTGRKRRIQF
jgi:18S rRNA (guanine1575-N7)-methyltransferase